ncbi:MAG: signal peptidase I [Bacilli bacterium]|nr:signal peptidase I [Bacilli bacterium]
MAKNKDKNIEKNVNDEEVENNTKKAHKDMVLEYMPYVIIIVFVVLIRTFIATPIKVNGSSMSPTLYNGDHMLLYKLTPKTRGIKRFDIVVISTDSGKLIKRVIGLPGEKIRYEITKDEEEREVATLYINGEAVEENFITDEAKNATCVIDTKICNGEDVEIPEGEYYVMGDNRINSKDSRMIGTVDKKNISGTTQLILFPFNRIGKVK